MAKLHTQGLESAWEKHQHCQMIIFWKEFANGEVTPGLYCKDYGIWIQWLDVNTAKELILSGVEQTSIQPKKKKGHPVRSITLEELGI